MVDVPQLREIDGKFPHGVKPELGLSGAALGYRGEFAVSHLVALVVNAELQPIANGELTMLHSGFNILLKRRILDEVGKPSDLGAVASALSQHRRL